ncbi:MAG: DUF4363 family protein [Clostridia bacterium]|nr:DUF4363 family protein [Clostridia bacterium]
MKSVISALLIFIFIIITAVSSIIYVDMTTKEMLQIVYKNEIYFSNSQWREADAEILKLEKLWNKKRSVLSVFINHTILTEVDTTVAKLKNATKMQENIDFFYESTNLALILLNINQQQKISIENIF